MKSFKSMACTFAINYEVTMAVVHIPNPDRSARPEGWPQVGEVVLIDGEHCRVLGIESSMLLCHPPYASETVGLRVIRVEHKEVEQ